ncbi:MAG TPA: ATP-dependent DNA ligase [Steroidobacteraceae bacterium]|jgi:ATP-dependent DNA ligase|nr:ATP-dependent DNA ligase [Steroidobacteraceae bacterium]
MPASDNRAAAIPRQMETMEARLVAELPRDAGWQYEPKWDGFRCLAIRDEARVELQARSGKSLSRYFPEMVAAVAVLPVRRFVVDGELVIARGETLSFEALQMRLHPAASRIAKLSAANPASLVLFDMPFATSGASQMSQPLRERRAALERFFESLPAASRSRFALTPYTRDIRRAEQWLEQVGGALDGVVAKKVDGPYVPGERAMLKVKRLRTADCVVGGYRLGSDSQEVGSLLLGLFNHEGLLDHVGFTAAIPARERKALTRRLRRLQGGPGFTGKAPGGPSRWSTERSGEWCPLRPELVVEVCYDQVTGGRFRHGTRLLRWRPDKAPRQCTDEQLGREARPGRLSAQLLQPPSRKQPRATAARFTRRPD